MSCSSILSNKRSDYPVSLQELFQLWMPALSFSSLFSERMTSFFPFHHKAINAKPVHPGTKFMSFRKEKRRHQGDLIAAFQHVTGAYKKEGE